MSGKGDKPRPIQDWDAYSENWDRIFGKKSEDEESFDDEEE